MGNQKAPKIEKSNEPFWRKLGFFLVPNMKYSYLEVWQTFLIWWYQIINQLFSADAEIPLFFVYKTPKKSYTHF